MSLLTMKLVEHYPGISRVYRNGLGFETTIRRMENTKMIPKKIENLSPNEMWKYSRFGVRPSWKRVPTGTSYINVIKNWGKNFLGSFNHGIHAPKV